MPELEAAMLIEELTGRKRSIELLGSGMARKGANWSGELKHTISWNPGNQKQATVHVLVAAELPSSWNGRWSTSMLLRTPAQFTEGSTRPIARAYTMHQVVEDILRGGQQLRVTFSQAATGGGQRIVREGVPSQWDFQVETADEIEWAITFDWTGRGPKKLKVDFAGDKTLASLRAANQALTDYTTEVAALDELQSVGGDVFTDSFGLSQLEQIANIPNEFTKQLKQNVTLITGKVSQFAKLITGAAATPIQFASSMLNIATIAINTIGQTVDEMGCVFPDALSNLDGDAAALVNASEFFYVSQDGGENILGTMAEIRASVTQRSSGMTTTVSGEAMVAPDILAVIISGANDTFAKLSMKYYLTADNANVLAQNNGFDEDEIAPPIGTTLVIPVINPVLQNPKI